MQAAFNSFGGDESNSSHEYLATLPGLCCQAAGGDPAWAGDLTLAWLLFYAAAHIMDSIQDGDEPEPWWRDWGPGVALNAASGLYFSGCLAINSLHQQPAIRSVAGDVLQDFFNSFLFMSGGQHADLVRRTPSLDSYWRQARAKSGAFFEIACRCGARLATQDDAVLQAYGQYGLHLGLLIQIKDDLDDIRSPGNGKAPGQKPQLTGSLPYVYALEVLPQRQKMELEKAALRASQNSRAARRVIELIDESGASLYLKVEMNRCRSEALMALSRAFPQPGPGEVLSALVQSL